MFVDLDDAVPGSALEKPFQLKVDPISASAELPPSPAWSEEADAQSVNRNGFSAALSCYPYVFVTCGVWASGEFQLTRTNFMQYNQRDHSSHRPYYSSRPVECMSPIPREPGTISPPISERDSPVRK